MASSEIMKIISKDSSLCNNWAGGKCYSPDGFRNSKLTEEQENKLPDCICKPGLYAARPLLFAEKKDG